MGEYLPPLRIRYSCCWRWALHVWGCVLVMEGDLRVRMIMDLNQQYDARELP